MSGLADAIAADRFVLTTSLGTLGGVGPEELRRRLREIREGFAFVKFGDNPRARARPSPWAAAAVALGEGLEPVVHVTCRDRNRLALRSDLLGGCDPNVGAGESHLARLREKLAAGASVLESQPVFDAGRFGDWLARVRDA